MQPTAWIVPPDCRLMLLALQLVLPAISLEPSAVRFMQPAAWLVQPECRLMKPAAGYAGHSRDANRIPLPPPARYDPDPSGRYRSSDPRGRSHPRDSPSAHPFRPADTHHLLDRHRPIGRLSPPVLPAEHSADHPSDPLSNQEPPLLITVDHSDQEPPLLIKVYPSNQERPVLIKNH